MDDARKAIFKKYAEPSAYEYELERMEALAPESRETALARLEAIDRLLSIERPTLDDADAQAAKLGIGRRNLYRLISRLKQLGPVTGLAPYARSAASTSTAKVGFPQFAEAALRDLLRADAQAPLSHITRAISEAYAKNGIEKPPSMGAIRNRVIEVRRPGGIVDQAPIKGRRFGRHILIDQTVARFGAPAVDVVLCFIIDVETRLIIGCGYDRPGCAVEALQMALNEARRAAWSPAFDIAPFQAVPAPHEIRWIVPDGLAAEVPDWRRDAGEKCQSASAVFSGERRHGQRLVDLMGAVFGGFTLTPRANPSAQHNGLARLHPSDLLRLETVVPAVVKIWNEDVRAGARKVAAARKKATGLAEVSQLIDSVLDPLERVVNPAWKSPPRVP